MILNTITLHNFMSYADARLDLASVSVACLSGANGAGKSALLDAVTWAIWESARSSSDDLIKLGEREMWVEVTFSLDGQQFRIRRSRQKSSGKGAAKSNLELQVLSNTIQLKENQPENTDASYTSLTAPTIRDTQRVIIDLLRMEYDTFVNSVYLRQGKADEFTTKPPAERKQVLADILGLSYFDQLQELSRDKARELKLKAELIATQVECLPEVEKNLQGLQAESISLNCLLSEAQDKVCFFENSLSALQVQLENKRLTSQRLDTGNQRHSELVQDIKELKSRQADLATKIQELEQLLENSTVIQSTLKELEQVKNQVQALDHIALDLQDLLTKRLELKSTLASTRSRLEVEKEHWQAKLKELKKKHDQLLKDTSDKEKLEHSFLKFIELVKVESELDKQQNTYRQLSSRSEELSSLITEARIRLESEIEQKETTLNELKQMLASSVNLNQEKKSLDEEITQLDAFETEFELVEEKGLTIKSNLELISLEIRELKGKQQENKEKIRELEEHKHTSLCPLCAHPIVDRLAVVNRYLKDNEIIERQATNLKEQIVDLDKQRDELRKRYLELKAILNGRKQLDTRIGQFNEKTKALARAETSSNVLEEELVKLKSKLTNQDFAQLERESLIGIKTEMHKLDFDPLVFSNLQSQIRAMRHIEARHQQLQKDLAQLKEISEEIPQTQERLNAIVYELDAESYATQTRNELNEIASKIEAYKYDRAEHEHLKERLSALMPCLDEFRELNRAQNELPTLRTTHCAVNEALSAKQEQLSQLEIGLTNWKEELTKLPQLEDEIAKLVETLSLSREKKEELAAQKAIIETKKAELSAQVRELTDKQKLVNETRQAMDDFLYLAEAFGKKGIQAVIIENAVPEIESEANRILSRLSDNQMHVALATRHKTKAGNTIETLDLLIGDEQGTRSYELYSGGESFKVDFSVRVALCRLLARRAGAKLETLIIDEGFGSQDESSRERLVKAINSIREDFARILVITHVAEVKEMFPIQIQVTKVAGSSQLSFVA